MSQPTIEEIVRNNLEMAIDQRHEYDTQVDNFSQWFEGDEYLQNVADTLIECGYAGHDHWENGTGLFFKLATEAGLRFAN